MNNREHWWSSGSKDALFVDTNGFIYSKQLCALCSQTVKVNTSIVRKPVCLDPKKLKVHTRAFFFEAFNPFPHLRVKEQVTRIFQAYFEF